MPASLSMERHAVRQLVGNTRWLGSAVPASSAFSCKPTNASEQIVLSVGVRHPAASWDALSQAGWR